MQHPRWQWPGGALEIGLRRALHVREERLSTRHDAYRVLYASDIHLRKGRSDLLCRQVLESVTRCNPDVVLLGGDLVDRRSELIKLSELVRKVHEVAPVFAIGGNHDRRIGINRVRDAVVHGGGQWIDDVSARVTNRGRLLVISGPDTAAPVDGHVRVLCAHDPRIWKTSRHAGYDLVLAGHLRPKRRSSPRRTNTGHPCWRWPACSAVCRVSSARHPGRRCGSCASSPSTQCTRFAMHSHCRK